MCLCMRACTCRHGHACMHACMRACVCACMCVCVCACMCPCVCMFACVHVCMCACLHVCMYAACMHARVRVCVCVFTCVGTGGWVHVCRCTCMCNTRESTHQQINIGIEAVKSLANSNKIQRTHVAIPWSASTQTCACKHAIGNKYMRMYTHTCTRAQLSRHGSHGTRTWGR